MNDSPNHTKIIVAAKLVAYLGQLVLMVTTIATGIGIFADQPAVAQNWRGTNPDQPNGYHASEASSHYHGNLHMPANQQNGYHASEARSHYGGSKWESPSGWNGSSRTSNNDRSWDNRSWGNRYSDNSGSQYQSRFASRWAPSSNNNNYQNGMAANGMEAVLAARLAQNMLGRFGSNYQHPYWQSGGGLRSREQELQNSIANGTGGFNRIYAQ